LPSALATIPFVVFLAGIAFVPLPFGSYDRTISTFWCALFAFTAAGLAMVPQRLLRIHVLAMAGIVFVALAYAVVLHEQLAEHPWIARPNPVWSRASAVLGDEIKPSVSVIRGEPLFALGPALACMLALICGMLAAIERENARRLLQVIAWSGVAYAIYGILSLFFEPTMLLWREKRAYVGNVTGTFVNRNTAAAYFGSCAVVWLAFSCEKMRRHLRAEKIVWKQVPSRLLTATPRALIVAFAMFFICLVAMFLTGSRAGAILSLGAMILTFTVFFRRDLPARSGIWAAMAGGLLAALIALQLIGGGVTSRFDVQGLDGESRLQLYKATVRMIADNPWFGTGLGTFGAAFTSYRSPEISMRGILDIAHSTPLEIAAEGGLPLAVIVCLGWLAIMGVLAYGAWTRRRDALVPLVALAVAALAGLHSCIDFSLQIPGYAIVVFALLGAGISQSFGSRADGHSR